MLRREIQILVCLDLLPDTLHVKRDTISGNALVVDWLEEVIWAALVYETCSQLLNLIFELVRRQDFVGQGCECQVKVVGEFAILEFIGFAEPLPDTCQISSKGCFEVRKRGNPDVVSNDEEKKSTTSCPVGLLG